MGIVCILLGPLGQSGTLTAEAGGPPVNDHPVLATLMGIGSHTGTEALTVTTPAAATCVRQAV